MPIAGLGVPVPLGEAPSIAGEAFRGDPRISRSHRPSFPSFFVAFLTFTARLGRRLANPPHRQSCHRDQCNIRNAPEHQAAPLRSLEASDAPWALVAAHRGYGGGSSGLGTGVYGLR